MKLAEALLLRADHNKTYEQLRQRIAASARYQEGERPVEDTNELVTECGSTLDELGRLIAQVNRTNSTTTMPDGRSVSDALAERDVLRLRYNLFSKAADAAAGSGDMFDRMRVSRSELRLMTDLDVSSLRRRAADVARQLRELDAQLQQVNWATELVEQ